LGMYCSLFLLCLYSCHVNNSVLIDKENKNQESRFSSVCLLDSKTCQYVKFCTYAIVQIVLTGHFFLLVLFVLFSAHRAFPLFLKIN